jgi:hypothetical protein
MSAHRQHVSRALRRRGLSGPGAHAAPAHRIEHTVARSSLDEVAIGGGSHDFRLWLPHPAEPIVVASFADAVSLAFEVADLPVERELLVLLDEYRQVTAMLLDPPPPLGAWIGQTEVPGLDVPFTHTLSVVLVPEVIAGRPDHRHRTGYLALRRMHGLQGLALLDVLLTDGHAVQSLALACDPDPIWHEPFEAA